MLLSVYTDTGPGSYLDATMKSYRPLDLVEACCDVRPINLTGELVMGLLHAGSIAALFFLLLQL